MLDLHSGIGLKEKNKEIIIKAPTRVDLSGGTLDIWPLFCFFENSKTINFGIDGYVELKITLKDSKFKIKEREKIFKFNNLKEIIDSQFKIYGLVFSLFNLNGIEIEILNMVPKSSGLGGSSSLLICLLKGLYYFFNIKKKNKDLILLCRDLEAKNMGFPTGTQDFYPPLYGGLLCINYFPGGESFEKLNGLNKIKKHLIIYSTGVPHHSGKQNFEVFKEAIVNKNSRTYKNLKEIASVSNEMYNALKIMNLKKIGELMKEEWDLRKELSPAFNHPEIDISIEEAKKAGVWGWKPSGAAGGGSVAFLVPEEKKETLKNKLNLLKGEVLPYNITGKGINIFYANR